MHKIGQPGGFLGQILETLLKAGIPLIGNALKQLAKIVLIPLRLTAAASATDAVIHKKMFGSGTITLAFSDEDLNDIMKIIKSLEEPGLLIKGVGQTIKNEAKEQKCGFLLMLLGNLGASLLRNMLAGKGVMRAGEGIIRAGHDF